MTSAELMAAAKPLEDSAVANAAQNALKENGSDALTEMQASVEKKRKTRSPDFMKKRAED